jgi:hypothetical protein
MFKERSRNDSTKATINLRLSFTLLRRGIDDGKCSECIKWLLVPKSIERLQWHHIVYSAKNIG